MELFSKIKAGIKVVINNDGQERTGQAVMKGPHGWVLNMGGVHGTPGIATPENVVSVGRTKKNEQEKPLDAREVAKLVKLVKNARIEWDNKREFARLCKKVFRAITVLMELPAGSYEIRWNAGGPAVSGDCILHGESIYVQFSQAYIGTTGFMYRSCKGRKDYSGGRNHWMAWECLFDLKTVAEEFKRVSAPLFQVIN